MYKKINLLRDPIWSLLRKVTIPASIGSLFQTFYNLVDTYFAGKISPEALSALAKSFPIYFIIIAIGVGVGAATNTLIGNSIGEKVSWKDPEYSGYYSRKNEFVAEFSISGRKYNYGNILYRFIDNREKLEVNEEVLLERIHDGLSVFAAKVRKQS